MPYRSAAAVGLAIGLSIPETERENEMLGEVRDSMIDRGKDAVRTAAERVQNAAGEVQRVAGDALKGVASGESNRGDGRQAQHSEMSTSQSAARTSAGANAGAASEAAVPGTQAGSGGTGATPTTSQSDRSRTR